MWGMHVARLVSRVGGHEAAGMFVEMRSRATWSRQRAESVMQLWINTLRWAPAAEFDETFLIVFVSPNHAP